MAFSLASAGKTDELREWLRQHPTSVNLTNTLTNETLVYTATTHSNRGHKPSVSSLQAAAASGGASSLGSPHLQTIRMLCHEFNADPCIPCGGLKGSCVFAAIESGSEDVLQYFFHELDPIVDGDGVPHRYYMKPNSLGETPLDAARRVKASASIVTLLSKRAHLEQQMPVPAQGTIFPVPVPSLSSPRGLAGTVTHRDPTSAAGFGRDTQDATTTTPSPPPSVHKDTPTPPSTNTSNASRLTRERLERLRVQDSDSDEDMNPPALPATGNGATYNNNNNNNNNNKNTQNASTSYASATAFYSSSSSAPPLQKRNEVDISQTSHFPNKDLQDFRREFGNGFTYVQCRDHYDIRGLLPYTYKGVEYYTPMIFLVYSPNTPMACTTLAASLAATATTPMSTTGSVSTRLGGAPTPSLAEVASSGSVPGSPGFTPQDSQYGSTPMSPHTAATGSASMSALPGLLVPYCRYRALIDLAKMDSFCLNRKAEYVDAVSGAIVPSACDGLICSTLLTFVRAAVLKNFERVPPMTPAGSRYAFSSIAPIAQLGAPDDKFLYHHSSTSPADMRDTMIHRTRAIAPETTGRSPSTLGPRTPLRHFRICQDLSRFGDGWLRYHAAGDFVNGFVPIYREKPKAVMTAVYGVSAAATAAAATSSTINPGRSGGGGQASAPKSTQEVVAMEVELVLLVRVQIRFQDTVDGHALRSPVPVCYLVSADASQTDRYLTFDCFRPLLVGGDPTSSAARALRPDVLGTVGSQFATGDSTLFDLLLHIQTRLAATVEGYARRYQAQHSSPVNRLPQGDGSAAFNDASSPLDDFFTTPTTGGHSRTPAGTDDARAFPHGLGVVGTSGVCVVCFVNQTTMVLQPCGHIAICKTCADRLESHNHSGRFPCPVCHHTVTSLEEGYL